MPKSSRLLARLAKGRRRITPLEVLRSTDLLDPVWYRETHADLRGKPLDAAKHYLEHGASEGRNPHPYFDTKWYLQQNPDVVASGMNPLVHYILHGKEEGRAPRPFLVSGFSSTQTSDATASGAALITRYSDRSFLEGMRLSPSRADEAVQEECQYDPDESAEDQIRFHIDKPLEVRNGLKSVVRKSLLIEGWAIGRVGIASVDIFVGAKHLGSAHYGLPRWDVADGHPGWLHAQESGFMITVPSRVLGKGRSAVRVSVRDKVGNVRSIEFQIDIAAQVADDSALPRITQAEADFYERVLKKAMWRPAFYVLVMVRRGSRKGLRETLLSIRQQVYADWKVGVLVEPPLDELRESLGANDQETEWQEGAVADCGELRDRIEFLEEGAEMPLVDLLRDSGPTVFFGLLSAGDVLSNDALLQCAVKTNVDRGGDFFYSDELRLDAESNDLERFLKPQWSPDLVLSTNYIGRLWMASASLLARTGSAVGDLFRWGEYDLILQLTERAEKIYHIPELLCERKEKYLEIDSVEQIALQRAVDRRKIEATVRRGFAPGFYRIQRKLRERELVSAIIPVGRKVELMKMAVFGLLNETGYDRIELVLVTNPGTSADAFPFFQTLRNDSRVKIVNSDGRFNFARLCNIGTQKAQGKFLLFLNDDVQIIDDGWLDALLEHAQRPEVGVVGPMLLWPNRTIQSAGVFLTNKVGVEAHAFRNANETDPCYFGLAQIERNVIAVNGACFMTRRDVFESVGGFNEAHRVINNETDYCLKAWREKYLLVYTPYSRLIHHERASRTNEGEDYDASAFRKEWGEVFADGDPFHHPNLSKERECFTPEAEPLRLIRVGYPLARRESIKRVLVVKLDHIGDCVTAFPAIRLLKEAFPHATFTALVSKWTRPFWAVAEMIDDTVDFDFFHDRADGGMRDIRQTELMSLRERLIPRAFDLAVDLRRHPETRHILEHTGARLLAGYDTGGRFPWLDIAVEWNGDAARVPKRTHASDELMRLAQAVVAACSPAPTIIVPENANPSLPPELKDSLSSRRFVCVHPAAGDLLKQWPAEYFAELINLLVKRQQVNVVLVGALKDRDISDTVLTAVDSRHAVFDVVGRLALSELPSLLLQCALFVGNDSGPKHIAGGLGIPTVGVHSGHVDAREWGPAGPLAIALQREMECGPCYLPSPKLCPRNLICLTSLTPGRVYDTCRMLLAAGPNDPRGE